MKISLGKLAFIIISLLLLADSLLPAVERIHTVDKHRIRENDLLAKNYQLILIDGPVRSCDVGYSAYVKIKDGDSVELTSSRIFRDCWLIKLDGEIVHREPYGRFLFFILGLVTLTIVFGWIKSDNE